MAGRGGAEEEDGGVIEVEALRRVSERSVPHGVMRCSRVAGSQEVMEVASSCSAKS